MSATATTPTLDISVSRVVSADPETVWTYLTDVAHFGELSPENVESHWLDEPALGARFKGSNRIRFAKWSSVATVTAFDAGRRFAFDTSAPSASRWSYDLEAVDGGTRVTESMSKDDPQPLPIRLLQRAVGVNDRAAHLRAGITTTLERLDAAVSR